VCCRMHAILSNFWTTAAVNCFALS
jgi:hypothetical protein